MSSQKCFVKKCRYNTTHTTENHVCGKCSAIGHGMIECIDNEKNNIFPPSRSVVNNQIFPPSRSVVNNHSPELKDLKVFGSVVPSSDIDSTWEADAISTASDIMKGVAGNIFCMLYAGMGCQWFVRRNASNQFTAFFMHGDSWNQYDSTSSDVMRLREFLEGYQEL